MRWTALLLLWPAVAAARQPEWQARALRSGAVYLAPPGFRASDTDGVVVAEDADGARVSWERAGLQRAMSALAALDGPRTMDQAATCVEQRDGEVQRGLCVCEGERGQLVLGQLVATPALYRGLGGLPALRSAAGVLAQRLTMVAARFPREPAVAAREPLPAGIREIRADSATGGAWLVIDAGTDSGVAVGWSGTILAIRTADAFAGLRIVQVSRNRALAATDRSPAQLHDSLRVLLSPVALAFDPAAAPPAVPSVAVVRAPIIDLVATATGTLIRIGAGSKKGIHVGWSGTLLTWDGFPVQVVVREVTETWAKATTAASTDEINTNRRVVLEP